MQSHCIKQLNCCNRTCISTTVTTLQPAPCRSRARRVARCFSGKKFSIKTCWSTRRPAGQPRVVFWRSSFPDWQRTSYLEAPGDKAVKYVLHQHVDSNFTRYSKIPEGQERPGWNTTCKVVKGACSSWNRMLRHHYRPTVDVGGVL